MIKLHIGCGKRFLQGYKHIDILNYDHIDIKCDISNIDNFLESESVDEIYCCHILEHINRKNIINVLCKLNKILKNQADVYISVPDFQAVVELYNEDKNNLNKSLGFLNGGQKNDYDYHYVNYDFKLMEKILKDCGFDEIERYNTFEYLPDDYDDYSKAYIPHMDFTNGKLMSLNIKAKKKKFININYSL